jgi:flavin-dependent dehydrogenase
MGRLGAAPFFFLFFNAIFYHLIRKSIPMQRETIEFDVIFIGGGPANLSSAIHLANLIRKHNEDIEKGKQGEKIDIEDKIAVLEKGEYFGAHNISGAVLIPDVLSELLPGYKEFDCPINVLSRISSGIFRKGEEGRGTACIIRVTEVLRKYSHQP